MTPRVPARLVILALVAALGATSAACAASGVDVDSLVTDVLRGFSLAGRADVRSCLVADASARAERLDEVTRLATLFAWMERAIVVPRSSGDTGQTRLARDRSDRFGDIVGGFNHERRIDAAALMRLSDGGLEPRHISAYARVSRALAAGHDPRRVMCGD